MINITQEEGCRTIIGYLTDEEIFNLLDTVTKKQIKATGKEEAVDAIISYTESAEEFLQRQKIKREMIFKYCHSEKIRASATSNKKTLINTLLKAWEIKDSRFMEMDGDEDENVEIPFDEDETPVKVKRERKGKPGRKPGKKGALKKSPEKGEPGTKSRKKVKKEPVDEAQNDDSSEDQPLSEIKKKQEARAERELHAQNNNPQLHTNTPQGQNDTQNSTPQTQNNNPQLHTNTSQGQNDTQNSTPRAQIDNTPQTQTPAPQTNTNIQHVPITNTIQSATEAALQYASNGVPQTTTPGHQVDRQNGSTSVSSLPPQINVHVHLNQYTNSPPIPMGHGDTRIIPPGHMTHPTPGDRPHPDQQTVNLEVQALGDKFVKWFYDNLNSFNPTCVLNMQDFGPQHFWDDVHLEIDVYTPHLNNETLNGPIMVSQRLLAFTKDDNLLFNPNISREGIYVKSSPHGLVKILACGSVHRGNACLGIFQQAFGIIRDPRFDNNWKIKYIKLQLKTGEVLTLPKLEGDVESQIHALVPL